LASDLPGSEEDIKLFETLDTEWQPLSQQYDDVFATGLELWKTSQLPSDISALPFSEH
jgi:hypothetical protein